jgi:hypothetical protein
MWHLIDRGFTALNITWLLTVREKNFKERRYFEENETMQKKSQSREKGKAVIPNAGQHLGDVKGKELG